MHRTNPVLRLLGGSCLCLGLLLFAGSATARAQAKVEDVPAIVLTIGNIHFQQTANKEILKEVVNPNGKVLNVSRVAMDPTKVLFEAIAPGRTRVKLVDIKDRIEFVDVVIISDRVAELRNMLKTCVPTASIQVCSSDSGNSVVMTGFVLNAQDARVVQQAAAQLFGANVVNNVQIGGVQQVQVEVVVAVVNRSEARNMAFSWALNGNNWFASSIFGAPLTFASALTGAGNPGFSSSLTQTGAANVPFGILNSTSSFLGFLQALRTEALAKIYAEPRVMTMSGRTGQIVSGGETPIVTAAVGGSSVTYKQFGTVVSFLPIVMGNGKIFMEINAEVSQVNQALGVSIATAGSVASAPGFQTRRASVKVQMGDGETLAIGGLVQNTINASINRVPVLGDMPFLGVLFSSKTYTEDEEELLILVTPRLVDPVDCCKIPPYLPGRATRAPDDFEFFLEGILEAPRGQRNVTALHYKPAYLSPNGNPAYPCNDASGCYRTGGGIGLGGFGGNCANGNCAMPPGAAVGMAPANYGPARLGSVQTPMPVVRSESVPTTEMAIPMTPRTQATPNLGPAVPVIPPMSAPMPESQPLLPPASFGQTRGGQL